MKILVCTLALFISAFTFAQDDVSAHGNTVTSKEIAPTWPGCENSKLSKSNCFNQKLAEHIQKNFKFPKGYDAAKDKGSEVIVDFKIDKKGKPEIISVSGGRKILQEAAKKNILSIPKMKPGSLNGKPRGIEFTVPFTF